MTSPVTNAGPASSAEAAAPIDGERLALSAYALSEGFRKRLETTIGGAPTYRTLSELRALPIRRILRTLSERRHRQVFLVTEQASALPVLSLLRMLTIATRTNEVLEVDPDLRVSKGSRWRGIASLIRTVLASLSGFWSVFRCALQVRGLRRTPLFPVTRSASRRVLYCKTNLMLGVKAGGSIGHVSGVVNALTRRGWGVRVLAAETPVGVAPGAECRVLAPLEVYGVPPEVNYYRYHERFVREGMAAARGAEAGFLYQRMSIGNFSGVVLARALGVPYVLEYNGSEAWIHQNWGARLWFAGLASRIEELCLRQAHLVVTVSEVLADELAARGLDRRRIVWYPNGVDVEVYDSGRFDAASVAAQRRHWGVPVDAVVLSFLGTFGQWHGAEVLAAAIRDLAVRRRDWLILNKVRFVLIGDGVRMAEVRRILSGDGCADFVTMTGLVPQAEGPRCLAASDILMSPHIANADGSRFFGSPTKLFEYMAMGKGIIASGLEQLAQVLQPGLEVDAPQPSLVRGDEVAALCRPGDVESLVRAIEFVVENPDVRASMGRNARRKVVENYTWDRHVEEILNALDRCIGPSSRGSEKVF